MKTPKIYRLQRPDLPWGDYGDVLAHGFADRSDDGSSLLLQRTGPFIPPFSQPSRMYVVVTAPLLRKLQESGLTGFAVLPVEVTKSPMIDWRVWQQYGNKEMKYPAGGEP